MRIDLFDYDLPEDLIAQEPLPRRDSSRLMLLDRATGRFDHRLFRDLPSLTRSGDLLVVNDTRVIPARLIGRRATSAKEDKGGTGGPGGMGGAVEALLLEKVSDSAEGGVAGSQTWKALLKGAKLSTEPLRFDGGISGRVLDRAGEEAFLLELSAPDEAGGVDAALDRAALMPTPPYIKRSRGGVADQRLSLDKERYQTVYAREPGAVAAPTAGLHFTPDLLGAIRAHGARIESLTLHVGWGTFRPVRCERVEDHKIHSEACAIPESLVHAVEETRRAGGRVVAVGTTVTRALEWSVQPGGRTIRAVQGRCDLFLHPGREFRVVDALVTNFHMPRSTLLMLVAAFAGREPVLAAYAEAIRRRYRFYSYGDAMLVA